MPTLNDVIDQALALSDEDRAKLTELLVDLAPSDGPLVPTPEQYAEWNRRVEELRSGKVVALDGDRVMAELRARYS